MAYVAKVMTMGDHSPAGLSHAYYNSPDGEPEDVVVAVIGYYDDREQLEKQISADVAAFESDYCSLEQGGGWVEVEEVDEDELPYYTD
jgi:hypothetical protein